MQKYQIGDRVICVGSDYDNVYAYYLKGSIGKISRYFEGLGTYELEFETVIDAKPEYRENKGHNLDNLVGCARFADDELELFEGEDANKPDPGFDLVFEDGE